MSPSGLDAWPWSADCAAPMSSLDRNPGNRTSQQESAYAWFRLAAALGIGTLTSVGMWSVVVALPAIQADFTVTRSDASLAYTMTMVGFGLGGVFIGRLVDSFGIVRPMLLSIGTFAAGYIGSAFAPTLLLLSVAQLVIGIGTTGAFAPLMADISHWFTRRRGIAVAICASGNYLGGALWPPVVQYAIAERGWRTAQRGIGLFLSGGCTTAAVRTKTTNCRRRQCVGGRWLSPRTSPGTVAERAAVSDLPRGRGVLCCYVDAASSHRCLLRRPRLRPSTRGRDAVDHAGERRD